MSTSSPNPNTNNSSQGALNDLFDNLLLAWKLWRDKRISPLLRFGLPLAALAYLIFPIDILPDVVPGLGQLDDIAVILLALRLFLQFSPADIVAQYKQGGSPSPQANAQTSGATPNPKSKSAGDPNVVDAEYEVY